MGIDIPQWLPQAYVRSVQAAGSDLSKDELVSACNDLFSRWCSADRFYHGIQHLIDTAATLETLTTEMHKPDLVRLAAFYHGAVFSTETKETYTRNGGENEPASAEFAYTDLLRLNVPEPAAARVAELIRGIRLAKDSPAHETTKIDAIDIDLQALRDAHLGVLAVDPQRYRRYVEQVRREYAHVPLASFLEARLEIVHRLLSRPSLFITPMARQWEESVRQNLSAEEQRLEAKLEALAEGMCPETLEKPDRRERDAIAARIPDDNDIPSAATGSEAPASAATPPLPRASEPEVTSRVAETAATPPVPRIPESTAKAKPKDSLSSLETCADLADPGVRIPEGLTPEEMKQLRREALAAEVRRRIEDRQAKAIRNNGSAGNSAKSAEGSADAAAMRSDSGSPRAEAHQDGVAATPPSKADSDQSAARGELSTDQFADRAATAAQPTSSAVENHAATAAQPTSSAVENHASTAAQPTSSAVENHASGAAPSGPGSPVVSGGVQSSVPAGSPSPVAPASSGAAPALTGTSGTQAGAAAAHVSTASGPETAPAKSWQGTATMGSQVGAAGYAVDGIDAEIATPINPRANLGSREDLGVTAHSPDEDFAMTAHTPDSGVTPSSEPSAVTPEWIDEDDDIVVEPTRYTGIEREPEF